jgi:hypothetical protein
MAKATELTRSGKLQEATEVIQSLLKGPKPTAGPEGEGAVIDGTFTRLNPDSSTPKTAPKPAPKPGKAPRAATPLSETLRKIAAGGMPARGPLADSGPAPAGAAFLSLTHKGPHGSRSYRLYVPANRPRISPPAPI